MNTTGSRYAVFFAPPPESELWAFGSTLIGYDAQTGSTLTSTLSEPDWTALTEEPRRYGFHGTLRAPFHLGHGVSEAALVAAAHGLAAGRSPFAMPRLHVGLLGSFVALVPLPSSSTLDELPANFADRLRANHRIFPRGIDCVRVSRGEVVGLPRSASVA